MGLIKDFLKNKKEQKSANLNLEQENIELKQQINELKNKINEMEMLHAEEISLIDREFLTWYSKQNNALNSQTSRKIEETDRQTRPEQLDLETKNEDLKIEELLNE